MASEHHETGWDERATPGSNHNNDYRTSNFLPELK
jgi:hypothetical protein